MVGAVHITGKTRKDRELLLLAKPTQREASREQEEL